MPVAAYNVSGEYAMVKAAAAAGLPRRARRRARGADRHPPRRRRHRHHLPREGRRHDGCSSRSPKVRSPQGRRGVPLDETDKQLLNLHAGPLPARARARSPRVAELAGITEDEVLARVAAPARRADHPPGHADLRHARARLRVDARRREGRPRAPAPRREGHQRAPGRHAQLPAQPRLQPVVHDRRRAGLAARPARARSTSWPSETGAESIRQLPTLKLFKIRMDLEMEGGTDALAAAAEAVRAASSSSRSSSTTTSTSRSSAPPRATCRSSPSPTRPPPSGSASRQEELLEHLRVAAGARRPAPRRRDPLPPPRRLLRQRHGRLEGARGPDPRDRPADGRLPRHLALLPAPDLRGLALLRLHDGPRALQGGVRRDPRRDRRARPAIDERATLYSSTEFKKIRLLYFTDDFKRLGARARRRLSATVSLTDTQSAELYAPRAAGPARRRELAVRAMRAIGRDPLFIERGRGRRAHRRRRQPLRRLGLLVGPADPRPRAPGDRRRRSARPPRTGTTFGAADRRRGRARRGGRRARCPSVEMLRMTSSGTEASMSAIRLARAATGREKLLKFAGAYHGHVDGLLAEAGSGLATQGIPASPGRARGRDRGDTVDRARGTTPRRSRAAFAEHEFAAILAEPYPANMGLVPPADGLPRAAARAGDRQRRAARLRRGHHRLPRRAAAAPRSSPASLPDLTVMGKVIGGGLPAAAYGGSVELMERIAPAGDVYQAGHAVAATRSPSPPALATLRAARRRRLRAPRRHDRARSPTGCARRPGDRPGAGRHDPGPADRLLLRGARARLRGRRGLRPRAPTPPGAARCSPAASTRRRRSSRPGSRRSPTRREHVDAHARGRRGGVRGDRRERRARPRSPPSCAPRAACSPTRRATRAGDARRSAPRRRRAARRGREPTTRCSSRRSARATCCTTARAASLRPTIADLALLAGDRLYALGLARSPSSGDLEAVADARRRHLRCAQAHAEGRPRTPRPPGGGRGGGRRRAADAVRRADRARDAARPRRHAAPSAASSGSSPPASPWTAMADRTQDAQVQVHGRPQIPGAFEGETVTRRRFMTRHRPRRRRRRRVARSRCPRSASPLGRRLRAAGGRLAGRRRRRTTSRRHLHPEGHHRWSQGIGEVGKTTVYVRKRNDGDRHRAEPTEYNDVHRDLHALHAPRLPGALRRGRRALHLPVPRRRLRLRGQGRRRPAGPPARPLLHARRATASVEVGPRYSVNCELAPLLVLPRSRARTSTASASTSTRPLLDPASCRT